ncbi:GAD-like domain-containing protein [Microbacterium koreense]|uniref:GAD-like domain-containing protein n=1 Tax=Microbacterium koreense TaxID=323761 RepID=A0ABW2ZS82_9MICO
MTAPRLGTGGADIADFVGHSAVEAEMIEAYRGRVPDEIIEIWENYGYGTFGEGFLRVINPAEYEAAIGDCIGKTQGDGVSIPLMVTGLGDLITWEPSLGGLVCLLFREGRGVGLGAARTFLALTRMDGAEHLSETLNWDIFPDAVTAHGPLPFDESFIFVPLLSLGGPAHVENLHKRQTLTAIQLMVDLQGTIGH